MFDSDNFLKSYLKRARSLNLYIDPKFNLIYETNKNNFHLTASGIVIKDNLILLIFHRYINKWFQPGGHIDEGELPYVAAQREVFEETGWHTSLLGDDVPVDIDIHLIPANPVKDEPEHWHIDCAFLLNPIKQSTPTDPEVSKWFGFGDVTNERIDRVLNSLT